MQIHDLDMFIGSLDDSCYFAVDDGTETFKLPADTVLPTPMTIAEAEAGTVTDNRVVSPEVFYNAVNNLAEDKASKLEVLVIEESVSSLPKTITNSDISDDMVCIKAELSNVNAQTGDWTVATSAEQAVISGSISGTTSVKLYLMKSK